LMPYKWRIKHDWIHKKADGTLEDPKEAFANRLKKNLRLREEQTGIAVYKFYTEQYLGKSEPPIIVFQNRQKFLNSLIFIKQRCFASITELKCQLVILSDTSDQLTEYTEWFKQYLEKRVEVVKFYTERKLSMLATSESVQREAHQWLDKPLTKAISCKLSRKLKAWVKVLADSLIGIRFIIENPLDCFARVVKLVHSLLRKWIPFKRSFV
jgi:hypothetical protein